MNYSEFVSSVENILTNVGDTDFEAVIPRMIEFAENKIYRSADLLSTFTANSTSTVTAGNRNFDLPAYFRTVEQINIITPVGSQPGAGTRNPLTSVSNEFLDEVYPSSTGSGIPLYFAMNTDQSILFGPWPDSNYVVEVTGTTYPDPLSATNTTTVLTLYYPDVFLAASLIWGFNYSRNDAEAAVWNATYQNLFASMDVLAFRQKMEARQWSSMTPSPIATPPG